MWRIYYLQEKETEKSNILFENKLDISKEFPKYFYDTTLKYLQALAIFSVKLVTLRVCSSFSHAFRLTILESKDKYLYMVFWVTVGDHMHTLKNSLYLTF